MALPAGRYGVTKNQLLKIKKLPMNTMKLIEELAEKYDLLGTAAFKNSTSVVTDSTDLVESGAVFNAIQGQEQLLDNTAGWKSNNLVIIEMQSTTYSDVEVTVYSNGTFKLNGTASADIIREIETAQSIIPKSGDYIFSSGGFGAVDDQNSVLYGLWIQKLVTTSGGGSDYASTYRGDNVRFTADKQTYPYEKIGIYIKSGQSFDNVIVRPALYHISVDEQKADNSVIAPVEDGATASQAYAVNDVFIRNGALCKVTSAISQGDTLSNQFTVTNVGAILTALLNA